MNKFFRSSLCFISQAGRTAQKPPRESISFVISPKEHRDIKIKITTFVDNNLGQVLRSNKIPLEFTCGFSCECGTCSVQIEDPKQFETLLECAPKEEEETITLASEGKGNNYRLACQILTTKEMDGMTFLF